MKIPISHPNLKPRPNGNKFTKNELKFIQFMEDDDELESYIISARKAAKIPVGGFDMNIPITKYTDSGEFQKMDYDKVFEQAELILRVLYGHIPYYWISVFANLIMLNIALPPERIAIEPIEIQISATELSISIRSRITRSDLMEFIAKNKDILDKQLKTLPNPQEIPKIRAQDLKLYKRIRQLDKEGFTYLEIAKKLDEENPSDPPELAHNVIGIYRDRYESYMRNALNYDRRREILYEALQKVFEQYKISSVK